MERSKSFHTLRDHFSLTSNHNNVDNTGSNNSLHSSNININQTAMNLRKAMELRQTRLQRQQLQLSGSSDNISALKTAAAAAGVNLPLFLPNAVIAAVAMRKNLLQRQQSTEYVDDVDYAADLEEDAEEAEGRGKVYERSHKSADKSSAAILAVTVAQQKRLLFEQQQQQQKTHSKIAAPHFNTSYPSLPTHKNNNSTDSQRAMSNTPTPISVSTKARSSSSSSAISLDGRLRHEDSFDSATDISSPTTKRHQFAALKRDNSTHSDSSRYSSVDSLLEARKPDPEAILINLGFGPSSEDVLARIPKRFLKPSQVRGIDTDAFVKRLQLASTLADHSALGYRGLTGNPDMPPSTIVAKIMQRFEVNERKKSMGSVEHTIR